MESRILKINNEFYDLVEFEEYLRLAIRDDILADEPNITQEYLSYLTEAKRDQIWFDLECGEVVELCGDDFYIDDSYFINECEEV